MSDRPARPDRPAPAGHAARLSAVTLDPETLPVGSPDAAHDRQMAIHDLLEANVFALVEETRPGPWHLLMAGHERGFVLSISDDKGTHIRDFVLSVSPLRRIIKDYRMICETYYATIREASPARIEAIDMGRRGLHNEGAAALRERLEGKITLDEETARRLFTLLAALHPRG